MVIIINIIINTIYMYRMPTSTSSLHYSTTSTTSIISSSSELYSELLATKVKSQKKKCIK